MLKYSNDYSVGLIAQEDILTQKPTFIRPLQELGELQEGRNAHFEAQLSPVSDPTMKVEWYKDGQAITASELPWCLFYCFFDF